MKARYLLIRVDVRNYDHIETSPIAIFFDSGLAEEIKEREILHEDTIGINYIITEV